MKREYTPIEAAIIELYRLENLLTSMEYSRCEMGCWHCKECKRDPMVSGHEENCSRDGE